MKLQTPFTLDKVESLKAGDLVKITGTIYTARDAGHKRMLEDMEKGLKPPFEFENTILYYVGPSPAKPGEVIGSAGPTTSYRMDPYTEELLEKGLKGMIGKGKRSHEVIQSMVKNKAVYFAAVGGAAALIADSIKEAEVIAYPDLGTEAVRKLYVEDFPVVVVIDCAGHNLYESEREKYRE